MEIETQNINFFIKTQVLNNQSPIQIKNQLTNAWGNDLQVDERQIYRLCNEFKSGEREHHQRIEGSGRPISVRTEESIQVIYELVERDNHISLQSICEQTGISRSTVQRILKEDLHKVSICARWHKNNRVEGAKILLKKFNKKVFVIDEKWLYKDPLPPKQNIRSWVDSGVDRPTLVKRKIDNQKFLIILAINYKGDYYFQIIDKNETITASRYTEFLQKLINFFQNEKVSIQHDNARPHKANFTQQFLEKNMIKVVDQPAYSPDTNLLDRYIFRNMEAKRRNITFRDKDHVFNFISELLDTVTEQSLSNEFKNFLNYLEQMIESGGEYLM